MTEPSALTWPRTVETPRLRLRAVQESDLPALLTVNSDDAVTRFLPYDTWHSLGDARAWYDRMVGLQAAGATVQGVLADKDNDLAIGTWLLFQYNAASARAELGYTLGRAHWGRGLMHEALTGLIDCAFGPLQLRRLEAEVDPDNQASSRLLLRLGFVHEGLLRQRWLTRGKPCDVQCFGLLSHEWPTPVPATTGD